MKLILAALLSACSGAFAQPMQAPVPVFPTAAETPAQEGGGGAVPGDPAIAPPSPDDWDPSRLWSLEAQDRGHEEYSAPSGLFTAQIPSGWRGYEAVTPRGQAVHLLGPELVGGAVRAAYHVHVIEKGKAGFVPINEFMKNVRERSKILNRQATAPASWRVDKKAGRVFEVREERLLPIGRLPAQTVTLHHFYALVALGREDYIVIKLSTTEETYLDYREEFQRFLKTFRTREL